LYTLCRTLVQPRGSAFLYPGSGAGPATIGMQVGRQACQISPLQNVLPGTSQPGVHPHMTVASPHISCGCGLQPIGVKLRKTA